MLINVKNQPINVLYIRCKLRNDLGLSISTPASFYIDKLEKTNLEKCKTEQISVLPKYMGNSYYVS